ncbi:hypothetical protein GCM10009430_17850 [Aquimarina litoralis]|uniref:Uncharacterized protein n=1 Tax=Aquimarina litoralis TaxID=584605 RepID=A0ABN1IQ53_9FLAO
MNLFIEDSIHGIHAEHYQVNESQSIQLFSGLSDHQDSELKLYKSDINDYTMSLNWFGINKWKIDYPIELKKVHKQSYGSKEQCVAIIKELYEKGNIDEIPDFIEVPISHFTLDEMLQFKKEDEMMLRGEDPDEYSDHQEISQHATISNQNPNAEKSSEASLQMGEQLGNSQKQSSTPPPTKVKTKSTIIKENKSTNNDNSLFSI